MKYFIILYRSVFFYILVSLLYRIMGKRELGELSIIDFIVSIFIAEIVAISIENYNKSILVSLIPIMALVLIQVIASKISMHNSTVRKVLDGEPSVIINKGKIDFKEMKKQRYNIEDLLMQLRSNSIKSIEEVDFAILEVNGKLSIFKKSDDRMRDYPLPLIVDGKIDFDVLKIINKKEEWLEKKLLEQKVFLDNVFYCFYKNDNLFVIERSKIN